MDCKETAEFVSALYDGETVPRGAAEHLSACDACQARLKSYMEMGVELRRVASLDMPDATQPFLQGKQQSSLTMWWHRGWEMMRIPRLAFALLLAGIVVLGSSLAVVGVRAHGEGTVVLLKVTPDPEHSMACPLSTIDDKAAVCSALVQVNHGILIYQVKLLRKDGNRVQLAVRSTFSSSSGTHSFTLATLKSLPEQQYWFEPGDTLQLEVSGLGTIPVTGEWVDHMPVAANENLDPGAGEMRLYSPLLIRDKQVVGDLEVGSAIADRKGEGVFIFLPGEGRFAFSPTPLAGGVMGQVKLNRITFESEGQSYTLLAGTPITREAKVWVRHEPNYKPAGNPSSEAFIGAGDLSKLDGANPAEN